MTNELHTSTEARKQLAEIRNGIRGMKTSKRSAFSFIVFFLTQASTKSEKELLNTSTETLKQLSEMMNEFRGNKAAKRSAFCERFL